MPVVPLAIMAGSAIISHYAAKHAQEAAQRRSDEEKLALKGGQGSADTLQTSGAESLDTGKATQAPATGFYDALLHGNRALQSQAVAAPTAKITDVYAGAERNLEQTGVRGAQKDVASADLNKGRASSIAGLITGVQPQAAAVLTSIGQTQQGQGAAETANAGQLYGGLLGAGNANRQYARGEGEKTAAAIGGLSANLVSGYSGVRANQPPRGSAYQNLLPNNDVGPVQQGFRP